jgi:membrane-bound ClpP family serine protease
MIALVITAVTLMLVGAIVISLERHRRLTPVTAIITGLGTLAVVVGAITATTASILPAEAEVVPRGVTTNQLPERVTDFDLPTL